MAKANLNFNRDASQLTPRMSPDELTDWWGVEFGQPFYCLKVRVLAREVGTNGEDFITFSLIGDYAVANLPKGMTYRIDAKAGGRLVWPYIPSTFQFVTDPKNGPACAFLLASQEWATQENLGELSLFAEDGGGNGGKWPLSTGANVVQSKKGPDQGGKGK